MNRPEKLIALLPGCLHWSSDGEIRVVGRRIGLFDVLMELRGIGDSPSNVAENYELAPDIVSEIRAFAERNKSDVDAYMKACQDELDRQHSAYTPSPAALRIRHLLEERKAQEPSRGS